MRQRNYALWALEALQAEQARIERELDARRVLDTPDPWAECRGQEHVKRALVVAATCEPPASVLLIGPPGVGKTLLAACGRTIGVTVWEARPCPCGNFGHHLVACRCTPGAIDRHVARAVRPIAEVAWLQVEVPPVPAHELLHSRRGTTGEQVREQVARAKAAAPAAWSDAEEVRAIIRRAASELGLSGRSLERVRLVACAVARLDGAATVQLHHVCEAIQYRRLDRSL